MRRFGKTENLWERISSDITIEEAMRNSLIKHKYPNMRVADYTRAQKRMIANWDSCKKLVKESLKSETYKFNKLHSFIAHEKKVRVIHCPQFFPDKIIINCVYIVLREYFYSKYVRNTYNCIKGRGIHDAKRAIERIMRKHVNWYYCQTDIVKFYPTINHNVLKADLSRIFKDTKTLRILYAVVDMFHEGIDKETLEEIGIAIGVNLSQLMAILILIPVLRDINEKWRFPCVGFTDDVFIAVPNKHKCHEFMEWYIKRCKYRGMVVKPNFRIAPMNEPLRIIGYEFRLNENKEQYTLLGKEIKLSMQERARMLDKMNVSDEYWKQQMASYFGWCKHACCRNLMRKTFGDRFKLFEKNMRTYQQAREDEIGAFGLKKKSRITIKDVEDKPICMEDAKVVSMPSINKETGEQEMRDKIAIKGRFIENNEPVGDCFYFISGSNSLKDRALRAQSMMPFIGTVSMEGGKRKYYVIK